MCLKLNSLEPKIADKDIVCYKCVKKTKIKGVYKASIQRFEYIIRQLYTNNINIKCVNNIIKCNQVSRYSYMHCIEGGMFHSYARCLLNMLFLPPSNYVVLKCIIPKGAYYFDGYSSVRCYASSQIKILEEVKF